MKWSDEYWPLIIQLYKNNPEGVKPLYSKSLVAVSLSLHIPPQEIHKKMQELRKRNTPYLKKLWEDMAEHPRKLSKAVRTLKDKAGLGNAAEFYEGVYTNESFECDFRPLEEEKRLTPVHLIMILNLYFQLTPTTMVADTEEIQELAKFINVPVPLILDIMDIFQYCDPYLNRDDIMIHPLLFACQDIWNRFGNDDTEKLEALAAQLKEYFK